MKISRFVVDIKEGKILFKSESHKHLWNKFLQQFNGKHSLEINSVKKTRSTEQSRYYFFYIGLIEDETGMDKDSLHELFKKKFLTQKITELYGEKVQVTKSTTELSRGAFCEYLLNISILTGVELPDTSEHFGSSYHK